MSIINHQYTLHKWLKWITNIDLRVKRIISMSFGEFVFLAGFIQKTSKEDLFVKTNHVYPQRNRRGKTLEDFRRQTTEAKGRCLPCGAGQPHLQVARPPRPTCQPFLQMSVFHRLLDCIYAVLSSRYDPRVQNWCSGLYIAALPPSLENPWNPNSYLSFID